MYQSVPLRVTTRGASAVGAISVFVWRRNPRGRSVLQSRRAMRPQVVITGSSRSEANLMTYLSLLLLLLPPLTPLTSVVDKMSAEMSTAHPRRFCGCSDDDAYDGYMCVCTYCDNNDGITTVIANTLELRVRAAGGSSMQFFHFPVGFIFIRCVHVLLFSHHLLFTRTPAVGDPGSSEAPQMELCKMDYFSTDYYNRCHHHSSSSS